MGQKKRNNISGEGGKKYEKVRGGGKDGLFIKITWGQC